MSLAVCEIPLLQINYIEMYLPPVNESTFLLTVYLQDTGGYLLTEPD